MKEVLKDVYQHCQDMQKMAETKNAGLIAFNSAITLAATKILIDNSVCIYFQIYLCLVVICSILSIFCSLAAISAQLKHKVQDIANHQSNNLLFFGTVSNYSPEEYLKKIQNDYNYTNEITQYEKDLAKQVVINAQIALRKFKLFNYGIGLTLIGITTLLGFLIYYMVFNNNK